MGKAYTALYVVARARPGGAAAGRLERAAHSRLLAPLHRLQGRHRPLQRHHHPKVLFRKESMKN